MSSLRFISTCTFSRPQKCCKFIASSKPFRYNSSIALKPYQGYTFFKLQFESEKQNCIELRRQKSHVQSSLTAALSLMMLSGARFSKVPKLFGRISGDIILFVSSKRRRHETLPLFLFLFPLQHVKRSALQNEQVVILRMFFRARKVLGTFEKRTPDPKYRFGRDLKPATSGCLFQCSTD